MSRRTEAVIVALAGMFVLAAAACEDSTSGADRVRAVEDAGEAGAVVDASVVDASRPDARPPSACVTCANAKASEELSRCGEACDSAMACAANCVTVDCESRCLRNAATLDATRFKVKLANECRKECTSIFDLVAGAQDYGAAICERTTTCSPALFPYRFPDASTCPLTSGARFVWSALLPGSGVSGTLLRACAGAVASTDCSDFLGAQVDLACQLRGMRLAGESCLSDAQCETGFCPSVDGKCATCALAPSEGAECAGNRCAPGLRCTTGGKCVRTARVGDACTARPCEPPATCQSGTCAAPAAVAGATCGTGTPGCDNDNGWICPSTGPQPCAPFVAVGPGASCGLSAGTYRLCHHGLACASTCPPLPKTGDACTTDVNCTTPDRCIGAKCTALPLLDSCP